MIHALALTPGATFMGGGWSPSSLGAALYDMWDAEDASKLTLVGSAVSAWASSKNGYSAAQAVGAGRPVYSANSFNGRPGLTFDGADDELTYAGTGLFPVSSNAAELWALVSQDALPADAGARYAFGYGGNTAPTGRGLRRGVSGGVNQSTILWGISGGSNAVAMAPGDYTGISVVRGRLSPTDGDVSLNGSAGAPVAGVPVTGSSQTRIGATGAGPSAANFWSGKISAIIVTAPLSIDQAAQMTAYLKARGGIA